MAEYRTFHLRLNTEADAGRIAWLERQDSYTDAIRALVDQAIAGQAQPVELHQVKAAIERIERKLSTLQFAAAAPIGQADEDPELGGRLDVLF